jgi:hypothetical protein
MKLVTLTLVAAMAGLSLAAASPAFACERACGYSGVFKSYPAKQRFTGPPRPVQFGAHDSGRPFTAAEKQRIRDEVLNGPNFAGAYRLVVLPCGEICKTVVVVDIATGRIHRLPETRLFWAEFVGDSTAIVVSALHKGDMRVMTFVFENGRFRRASATS